MPATQSANPPLSRRLPRSIGARQFGKFVVVGGSNTILDTAIFTLLLLAGGGYVIAKLVAATVATVNGYALNNHWTFRAGDFEIARLGRYVLVQAIGFGTNLVLLIAFVESAGLHPLVAQALSLPAVAGVTFLANKHWTFRASLREPDSASA